MVASLTRFQIRLNKISFGHVDAYFVVLGSSRVVKLILIAMVYQMVLA
jgi:hypothetical protein